MTPPSDRRAFLKGSSGGLAVGGLEAILAARRAPAHARVTRLHLLEWSHFIPGADALFDAQAREFGKQAGVEIAIERISENDIQVRTTRQVGFAGPPGRKTTEALSKFILVDMFAKSIQGMPPEDAVRWADGELKRIYAT